MENLFLRLTNSRKESFDLPLSPDRENKGLDEVCTLAYVEEGEYYEVMLFQNGAEDKIYQAHLYLGDERCASAYGLCCPFQIYRNGKPLTKNNQPVYKERLFRGQVDLVQLKVQVMPEGGSGYEPHLTPKLILTYEDVNEKENIEQILRALMEFDDQNVLTWLFQRSGGRTMGEAMYYTAVEETTFRSMGQIIASVNKIAESYKKNSHFFQKRAKHKVLSSKALQDAKSVRSVGAEDLCWLAQNAETLHLVPYASAIHANGKHYMPLRMQANIVTQSRDIYENRVILAFLMHVLQKAKYHVSSLSRKENELDEYMHKLKCIRGINNSPAMCCRSIVLDIIRNQRERMEAAAKDVEKLYKLYASFLDCKHVFLKKRPRCTKIFQEVAGYNEIYRQMTDWFSHGSVYTPNDDTIFQLKTMDKLYEYYCLQRILSGMRGLGLIPAAAPSEHHCYSVGLAGTTEMANTFHFYHDGAEVTLYYEPIIRDDVFENGLGLYRIDRDKPTIPTYRSPDFVIKIERSDHTRYYILDAKFSAGRNIEESHLPSIVEKYYVLTGARDFPSERIVMVQTLQGRIDKGMKASQWNTSPLAQTCKGNPVFGNCPVTASPDADGLSDLLSMIFEQ